MLLNDRETLKRAHEAYDRLGSWDAVRDAVDGSEAGRNTVTECLPRFWLVPYRGN